MPSFLRLWRAESRPFGHEAEHVADRGMASASDDTIRRYAERAGAVIVTKDEDFAVQSHPVVRSRGSVASRGEHPPCGSPPADGQRAGDHRVRAAAGGNPRGSRLRDAAIMLRTLSSTEQRNCSRINVRSTSRLKHSMTGPARGRPAARTVHVAAATPPPYQSTVRAGGSRPRRKAPWRRPRPRPAGLTSPCLHERRRRARHRRCRRA